MDDFGVVWDVTIYARHGLQHPRLADKVAAQKRLKIRMRGICRGRRFSPLRNDIAEQRNSRQLGHLNHVEISWWRSEKPPPL